MSMKKTKKHNVLEFRDGRIFENGRWLPKKDYIYHASSEGSSIISCITGQLYRLRNCYEGRIVY